MKKLHFVSARTVSCMAGVLLLIASLPTIWFGLISLPQRFSEVIRSLSFYEFEEILLSLLSVQLFLVDFGYILLFLAIPATLLITKGRRLLPFGLGAQGAINLLSTLLNIFFFAIYSQYITSASFYFEPLFHSAALLLLMVFALNAKKAKKKQSTPSMRILFWIPTVLELIAWAFTLGNWIVNDNFEIANLYRFSASSLPFLLLRCAAYLLIGWLFLWAESEDTTNAHLIIYNPARYMTGDDTVVGDAALLTTYKELLDDGTLTREEFDFKKQQILYADQERKKNALFTDACANMRIRTVASLREAIEMFRALPDREDIREKIDDCVQLEEAKSEAVNRLQKQIGSVLRIAVPAVLALAVILICVTQIIVPFARYGAAKRQMKQENYVQAIEAFTKMDGFRDSHIQIQECKYQIALSKMNSGEYDKAIADFEKLYDYKDSQKNLVACKKENTYEKGIKLAEQGEYNAAVKIFDALGDYKESKTKLLAAEIEKLSSLKEGDTLYFGTYEQDNDMDNGTEPIVWRVKTIQGNKALLISEHTLDAMPFNKTKKEVTWENSTIRQWLGDTFYNAAFRLQEQEHIATVTVKADRHPGGGGADPGNDTQDKIFLLSMAQVKKYFPIRDQWHSGYYAYKYDYYWGSYKTWHNGYYTHDDMSDAACTPTAYAKAHGAADNSDWWLRSPGGDSQSTASFVYTDGDWITNGKDVDLVKGVRPAMWVTIG